MAESNPYAAYVLRFAAEVGELPIGGYGKWKGRLIRKLTAEEFESRYGQFRKLDQSYRGILERGDTMSDGLQRMLDECRSELLIEAESA